MAINFPNSPTIGQAYELNGEFYIWNGVVWAKENQVQNIIQYLKTGNTSVRPSANTLPSLFYNTDLNGLELYYPNIDTWEVVSTFAQQVDPTSDSGQTAYTLPGTYSWVCPANVYQVHVVCVGGGGGGGYISGAGGGAGGGGGLGWENNISVTPGNSYTVVVGTAGDSYPSTRSDGGDSYFISTSTVAGFGGKFGSKPTGGAGGSYYPIITSQGGTGGNGGNVSLNNYPGGGGGAGGYSGNGGKGGNSYSSGSAGTGGAAGGGGGGDSSYAGGAGGGVGILGQGGNGGGGAGSSTTNGSGGGGGSGGSNGGFGGIGGTYGGGAGGSDHSGRITGAAGGAVRIIWGPGRSFPSTNTGDV